MNIPKPASKALHMLISCGFEAYVVGGCVRDSIMGLKPHDWDITTNARPDEIKRCFSGYRALELGVKYGTITLLIDECQLEITTYRIDGEYSDFRRPDSVSFTGSLKEDLSRRDFTMNAIAYCPETGMVDFFGGCGDIEARRIVCVGNPARRFSEDALRILRAVRFAAVLGFEIESETLAAAVKSAPLIEGVARERVYCELSKALTGSCAADALSKYADIFTAVIPELKPMHEFEQQTPYHHLDVWKHTVETVRNTPPDLILRIAMLFHDSGKPSTFTLDNNEIGHFFGHAAVSARLADTALRRLRCDNATREEAVYLIERHCDSIKPDAKLLKRRLNRMGNEKLRRLVKMKRADSAAQSPVYREERERNLDETEALIAKILEEHQAFSIKDLAVNGNDLKAAGFASGKVLGEALDSLLSMVIDDQLPNERDTLLAAAKKILNQAYNRD